MRKTGNFSLHSKQEILKMRANSQRGAIGIDKIIIVIIVIVVVASVLIFLFKTNINNWLKNLPSFKVPEEEKVGDKEVDISGQSDVAVDEAKKPCIYDAFWSKDLVKIKKGSEIKPGLIEFTLKTGNIENCKHRITITKNVGASEESMDINKDILTNTIWKNKENLYYIDYDVKDSGLFNSGKYSFAIFDSTGKKVFNGYEIVVED